MTILWYHNDCNEMLVDLQVNRNDAHRKLNVKKFLPNEYLFFCPPVCCVGAHMCVCPPVCGNQLAESWHTHLCICFTCELIVCHIECFSLQMHVYVFIHVFIYIFITVTAFTCSAFTFCALFMFAWVSTFLISLYLPFNTFICKSNKLLFYL